MIDRSEVRQPVEILAMIGLDRRFRDGSCKVHCSSLQAPKTRLIPQDVGRSVASAQPPERCVLPYLEL